jgi:LPXTG-motif cell wall-anchored protein
MKKFIAIALSGLFVLGVTSGAQAEPSEAVRYGEAAAIIGTELVFTEDDDAVAEVALPFPINFFGTKYDTACIDINGTLHFLESSDEDCSGSNYNDPLDELAAEYQSPMISALALDLVLAEDSSIHAGPFESNTMFVITWSEMQTFNTQGSLVLDDDFLYGRDPQLSYTPGEHITFQLVIKKAAGGSDATGFDFDLEWNYETASDLGGGYWCGPEEVDEMAAYFSFVIMDPDAAEPFSEEDFIGFRQDLYEASNDFCWPVGWANYDSVNDEGVDVFDLFAPNNRRQMIDGGSESLIGNRLNSEIDGRYILTMSGGETVGFPASNNSPAAPAATTTPKLATTGANVEWLLVAGLIAVIAGAGFLTVSRRKRTA